MITKISTQSKNEVEELLNNYVVSPLNDDISKVMSEIKNTIDDLEELTKKEIKEEFKSTNGRLREIRDNVKDALDTLDKISNSQGDFLDEVKNRFFAIQNELSVAQKQSNKDLENIKDVILQGISSQTTETSDQLRTLGTGITSEIKSNHADLLQSFDIKTAEISTLFANMYENGENLVTQNQQSIILELNRLADLVENGNENLQKRLDLIDQNLSTNYEKQHLAVKQMSEQIGTSLQTSEQRVIDKLAYKQQILFILSLSFGIVNIIGIVVLLLLFLI